jgi:DNA-binding MarR family transcriptional regulator
MSTELVPFLNHLLVASQELTAPDRARAKMTSAEYTGLQHLAHHREGLTPSQLGARLAITSGSVTKLVDRLEARSLASRIRRPGGDRRSVTIVATAKGVDLISRDLRAVLGRLGISPAESGADRREVVERILQASEKHSSE